MSSIEDDVTVVLFQSEPGKPMEVMPAPEVPRNIAVKQLEIKKMGINTLVDEFTWVLACLTCIPSIPWLDDPTPLREQISREIQESEKRLLLANTDRASLLVMRYCVCAAVDEAVYSQEWGEKSNWSTNSLLAEFHNETSGGDKFYTILERLRQDPKRYRHLIEFLYFLLQVGFKGKYGRVERGNEKIADIADTIYQLIREDRLADQEKLQLVNLKAASLSRPLRRVIPPKLIMGVSVGLIAAMYAATYLVIDLKFNQLVQ
ncbi:type IVB secretion system protein IcmH/DotU (plasmid) [Photobacterium sp. GJ3]|uniref:type IVB secretion system protein IcmH/DotU n=1 Tax=Photobacterium sp. GJ3 TaxID=2829502 RepID=UPI001B8C027E|nr:type IVB secretion system protein IcmH/DotU [Photobacterium sp. GJ3]QUJ70034.1 type IVB secretion system protein IcmH/DotU [Photobacterium sp. GJ3]